MVAHRTSVISHVDKLLVLVNGRVHMMGPVDDVIAQLGAERDVSRGQMGREVA